MKRILLGAIFSLAAVGGQAAPAANIELRVVSFNMLGGDGTGGSADGKAGAGQNAWAARKDLVAELIRGQKADVVSLQKAGRISIDDLKKAFPNLGAVGVGRDDGKSGGEFAAILYRTDRFKLDASGTFWLSETPDTVATVSWGARQPRVCSWARLVDQATGIGFYVFNTHLDPGVVAARDASAALILDRIKARAHQDPYILTGDMNSGEASSTIAKYKVDLVDTFRVKHPEETGVGTRHQFSGNRAGDKVDYILVPKGVEVVAGEILRDTFEGKYPSDHFPVGATLRVTSSK